MIWHKNANGNPEKPAELDTNSSKIYNYIRKDFEHIPAEGNVSEHWEWKEAKIRKEDWELFEEVMDHSTALDDVYAALTELAELIEEGE